MIVTRTITDPFIDGILARVLDWVARRSALQSSAR